MEPSKSNLPAISRALEKHNKKTDAFIKAAKEKLNQEVRKND